MALPPWPKMIERLAPDPAGSIRQIAPTPDLLALLTQAGLQTSDISGRPSLTLFGCFQGNALTGTAGIEQFGEEALLRSVAVDERIQKQGVGRWLVLHAENMAHLHGIRVVYLLTTTARSFFEKQGYQVIARHTAPASIRSTSQFSGLCPDIATLMSKKL